MKKFALLCLLGLATADQWAEYKGKFGRKYSTEEDVKASACFFKNLKLISERNALGHETHGINHFTDMCREDFNAKYLTYKHDANRKRDYLPLVEKSHALRAANGTVDWRTKGAVTPVKNQAQCGSCWAFSSTGNMEGQWFLAGHKLVSLSEQELVSCAGSTGNQGCQGGLMDNAFKWIIQKGGATSEENYPYTSGGGTTGTCKPAKEQPIVATFTSYKDIAKNEAQMAAFVEKGGPLAVAVDAQNGWQTYHGGIMKTCSGKSLDHGVLVVGYGSEGGVDFWIVKNSWAAMWGEKGYIRLQRGTNQCGIDLSASTIIANSGPAPTPPPAPTPGPTPAPTQCSAATSFQQAQCIDGTCLLCEKRNFPANTCIPDQAGGSVEACCGSDGQNIIEKIYQSTDCSGTPTVNKMPTNKCMKSGSGGYFKNVCGAAGNMTYMH